MAIESPDEPIFSRAYLIRLAIFCSILTAMYLFATGRFPEPVNNAIVAVLKTIGVY